MQNPKQNYFAEKPPFSSPGRRPDSSSQSNLPNQFNQPSGKPNLNTSDSKPTDVTHFGIIQKPAFQGSVQGISFANPFGHPSYNKQMSRSYVKKDVNQSEIETFMRDTKEKFFKISKSLFEHEQLINQLRDKSSSTNSSIDYKFDINTSDSIKSIQRQLESEQLKTTRIFQQIDRLRADITDRFLKKDEFDFNINRFELRLIDNFTLKKEHSREVAEVRDKMGQQIRNVCDFLRKQLQSNIMHIHQTNRDIFSKIQRDMIEIRQVTQQLKNEITVVRNIKDEDALKNIFNSNKKCFDVRIVKYRETLQKIGDKPYEKSGEEMTISQSKD